MNPEPSQSIYNNQEPPPNTKIRALLAYRKVIMTFLIVLFLAIGTIYWYLTYKEFKKASAPTPIPTVVSITPLPSIPIMQLWVPFTNRTQEYSLKVPNDWIIDERESFLTSVHIYPPGKEFEMVISNSQIPHEIGNDKTIEKKLLVSVAQANYDIQEITVEDKQVYFEFKANHPTTEMYILTRTLNTTQTARHSLSIYESQKETILKILESIEFAKEEAPWQTYTNEQFNYSIDHPTDWEASRVKTTQPSEWEPDGHPSVDKIDKSYGGMTFYYVNDEKGMLDLSKFIYTSLNGYDAYVNENAPQPLGYGSMREYYIQIAEREYIQVLMSSQDTNIAGNKSKATYPKKEDIKIAEKILNSFRVN